MGIFAFVFFAFFSVIIVYELQITIRKKQGNYQFRVSYYLEISRA